MSSEPDHPTGDGMREGDRQALYWFASLSTQEQRAWLDQRIKENAARRLRECEVRGHVFAMGEKACPHCDTPYDEIEQS